MKHIVSLNAVTKPFDGFWMKSRLSHTGRQVRDDRDFLSQETLVNTPITEMVVNTLITTPDGSSASVKAGQALVIKGIAWDAAMASTTSRSRPMAARMAAGVVRQGRWPFRLPALELSLRGAEAGRLHRLARATNRIGQTQADSLIFNPAGYHNNVPLPLTIIVA